MGTPRETIRIVEEKGLINLCNRLQEKTSLEKWSNFQINFTNDIRCGWFYFKNRSPSCGTRDVKIYSGFEKAPAKGKGPGLFGGAVIKIFRIFQLKKKVDCRILLLENISLQGYLQSHITR